MPAAHFRRPALAALAITGVLAASACSSKREDGANANKDSVARYDSSRVMGGRTSDLADAQIGQMIVAAHSADSAAGTIARTRGSDQRVRDYGNMMARDHGSANRVASAMAARLGPPTDSGDIREMRDDAADVREDLVKKSGRDFDKAYIDHEVTVHQNLLEKLDQELIAAADNPELRQMLEATRPVVAAHLERALEIQRSLNGEATHRDSVRRH